MSQSIIGELLEKRRMALVGYSIGQVGKTSGKFAFVRTPEDLFELLRLDPLDSYQVPTSEVAEAIRCAQSFIHAVYQKQEPGYTSTDFPPDDLQLWQLYSNFPDWSAVQQIKSFPENFITPYVRRRKTRLFSNLENDLNQTQLNSDSVQIALRNYLQAFEGICNLDVQSAFLDGDSAVAGRYYFVSRERVPPYRYFWREAVIELTPTCVDVNPAAWSEVTLAEIGVAGEVLDMRPVQWGGRLCMVWAEMHGRQGEPADPGYVPYQLQIKVAFKTQNGQWSAPLDLQSSSRDSAVEAGSRLIATVKFFPGERHGRLGVVLLGADDQPLVPAAVRDVLFRQVREDDGGWAEALARRFVDGLTVQHALSPQSQPTVVESVPTPGSLTEHYRLQVLFLPRASGKDVLAIRGILEANSVTPAEAVFTLEMTEAATGDPKFSGTRSSAGGWDTGWLYYERSAGGFTSIYNFVFGASNFGSRKFTLSMTDITGFDPAVLEKNRGDAAQFLAFNKPGTLARVRINSLFGPDLVEQANSFPDAALDWDMQFIAEPPSDQGPVSEPNGAFNGANGLYFWELFFHLPHLLAIRLRDEDRYPEAQAWLHRLFDPQAVADPPSNPPKPSDKPRYWRCRPLVSKGNLGCEAQMPDDPDAIGYGNPTHFQLLVFSDYVKNLIAQGDWYFRQLTPDSLVAAKLAYVRAQFLMGPPPAARSITDWQAQTIGALLAKSASRPDLEAFEQRLDYSLADVPAAAAVAPAMGLLANPPFKLPSNARLLALFQLPRQRLYNLRNNLTIDGKLRVTPLFGSPTAPEQLLRDLAAGANAGPRPMGGRVSINGFRWRVNFEFALRSVQALQDYSSQVLRVMELRDRAEQEELQHNHLLEVGNWTATIQEKTIAQMQATLAALQHSRVVVQERVDTLSLWVAEDVSLIEREVMNDLQTAKHMNLASAGILAAGGIVAAIPKIFGTANGGGAPQDLLNAVAQGLQIGAMALQTDAEKKAVTEGYRLRRREWASQRSLAAAEALALDEQIIAQELAVGAARDSLQQTQLANSQALQVYEFLKKRSTNAELYGWLLGQLNALLYQAYDATVSLCISAQASLSAETGDYDAEEPLPQVWLANRFGLTAAEHLREYLMRIERKYLQSFERRLERLKTFSLRQLFDDRIKRQSSADSWEAALEQLLGTGELAFSFGEFHFNRHHPGEYCRLIRSVEVHLPMVAGAYENPMATLDQLGSRIITRPSPRAMQYLHEPDESAAPADILFNLRSGQRIAISRGMADDGRVQEDSDPGLLRAFEHTGVDSNWLIRFPRAHTQPQASMLASLTDILIDVRYTAKAGESTFAFAVEDLVTAYEEAAAKRNLEKERQS
jgi:hypothetical protein